MLKKVLVVDDSALIHQMYKMVLMRYRCEIVQALNGQDGIDKLEKNPDVNMMLVDINMPLMNGLESDGFGNAMNCSSASAAIFGEHLYVGTYTCGLLWIPPFQVWRTEGGIFSDGFESGDTSAWSATVP